MRRVLGVSMRFEIIRVGLLLESAHVGGMAFIRSSGAQNPNPIFHQTHA